MPGLLRDVLCIIETFHKYAREDGDRAMLTHGELKQLLQSEFGDFLQPHVIHAVQRKLNLLGVDSASTIHFDEFVLAIFNLLNFCYFDIQSLLTSEPRQVRKPEEEKPQEVDQQVTTGNGQQTEGTMPAQDKVVTSPVQLSTKERRAAGHDQEDAQGGTTVHNLPRESSEHNGVKIHHLEAGEQNQEVAPKMPATKDNGAQLNTNKSLAGSEQTRRPIKKELQNREYSREGDKPAREQNGPETKGQQQAEQERNLKQEPTQRQSEDQEVSAHKGAKKYSESRDLPLHGAEEPRAKQADLPALPAIRKTSRTQKSADLEVEGRTPEKVTDRTSESQESREQKSDHTTQKLPVQDVSETPDIRAEKKEGGHLKSHGRTGQKEGQSKIQPSVLETSTQDEKDQELQGPAEEKDTERSFETPDLISEDGKQNNSETEGKQARYSEEDLEETLVDSTNSTAAKRTPGARERTRDPALLWHPSRGENGRIDKTHDVSAMADDGYGNKEPGSPVTQVEEGSSGTPHSPALEENDYSSETGRPPVPRDSQDWMEPREETAKRHHSKNPETWQQESPGENRAQEAVESSVGEEGVQFPEGQEQPAKGGCKRQGSVLKDPGTAGKLNGHPEAQERDENGKSLQTDISDILDADFINRCSLMQLPAKENGRREPKILSPKTREEQRGASETHNTPLTSLDEHNSVSPKTHLETEESTVLEEENGHLQELAEEDDDQQSPTKENYAAEVPELDLEQRMYRDQEFSSMEKGIVHASPRYHNEQEKILEQTDRTQEEPPHQVKTAQVLDPELHTSEARAFLPRKNSNHPVFIGHREVLRQHTKEFLPDEDPVYAQQTPALQAWEEEKGHSEKAEPVLKREVTSTKQ
ncbi:trichohyalin-like protein 1 [Ochotona curzoniae]|uniref:trichohyalin-like protein 1 n=1 Tax=Ochotona curzoniae TaxID=130825 RepID=UPI001B352268|nr:trichohyalin-like protein 1 [Ochotona curzoniae]